MGTGKGMGGHQSANSRTDEWFSPIEIVKTLGPFDLDPCTAIKRPWPTAKVHYTIEDNGLLKPWFGRIWLNPPYGDQLETWLEKMALHLNGIALTFGRTDTVAFQSFVFPVADSIFFIKRRVYFCNGAGMRAKSDGGAPSVLIAYGEQNSESLASSGFKGYHLPINYSAVMVIGVSPTWISVVTIAIRRCGDEELKPVYEMVERIAPDKVAGNRHWKEKIRQQMQILRKKKQKEVIEIDVEK
jgi:hypothetical protein